MKRKIVALFIVVCLGIPLVACGGEDKALDNSKAEIGKEGQETQELEKEEGIELAKSLGSKRPTTLKVVSEITSLDTTTIMTVYYDGDKSRTEIEVPGVEKSILIYIPSEEVIYQFMDGQPVGLKIIGADESSAEELNIMENDSIFEELLENSSDNISASVEHLEAFDGEKVIYIESRESDDEEGEMLVKMWYSEKYATPLKYELYTGEVLTAKLVVTEISDSPNFNADTFMPPTDVTFQEMDMEKMNDMN